MNHCFLVPSSVSLANLLMYPRASSQTLFLKESKNDAKREQESKKMLKYNIHHAKDNNTVILWYYCTTNLFK